MSQCGVNVFVRQFGHTECEDDADWVKIGRQLAYLGTHGK